MGRLRCARSKLLKVRPWPPASFVEGPRYPAQGAKQLGRIARNRKQTGIIAEGEQDNIALWRKLRSRDESFAHLVSRRIVDFAREQSATILVFEHLGNLKPTQGKYSSEGTQSARIG